MSKYIKLEDAIGMFGRSGEYHADAIVDMLFYLPTIDIVHCEDCRWRDDCSQTVANFEKTVNTVLRWCSDGVRKEE